MLVAENLVYTIEGKKILNNLSIQAQKNEITAIIGGSGSGKTTLLKALAGLLTLDSGKLKLDNERVLQAHEKLIPGTEKVKIVRQDFPLFPNISLRENIEYPIRFYTDSYRNYRVKYLLKLTGLKNIAEKKPREVSAGEYQRAVIATALSEKPLFLLLDEPYSNLDFANKTNLKREIEEIVKSENLGCILVTHEVQDVFDHSDKLMVLRNGKVIQKGTPMEVYLQPKNTYVAGLLGPCYYLSQKQKWYRPEQFSIKPYLSPNAKVLQSIFFGFYYRNKALWQGEEVLFYSLEKLLKGQEVHLDFQIILGGRF